MPPQLTSRRKREHTEPLKKGLRGQPGRGSMHDVSHTPTGWLRSPGPTAGQTVCTRGKGNRVLGASWACWEKSQQRPAQDPGLLTAWWAWKGEHCERGNVWKARAQGGSCMIFYHLACKVTSHHCAALRWSHLLSFKERGQF